MPMKKICKTVWCCRYHGKSDVNEVHLDSDSIPVISLKSCVIWASYLSLLYTIEIIIDLLILRSFYSPSVS